MNNNKADREFAQELRERIKALVDHADGITRQSEVLRQHSDELRQEANKLLEQLHAHGGGSSDHAVAAGVMPLADSKLTPQ